MIFSLPVKQQGIWKCQAAETPTCLSFIEVQSPKKIEVVTNLIVTALYRDRTDHLPILTFSKTACCIQLHSRSVDPKFIQLLDKHLTSYQLYFPNLNIREMLNLVRLWVWCNKIRSFGHLARLISNENRIQTTAPVKTEIQRPKFPRFPTMC